MTRGQSLRDVILRLLALRRDGAVAVVFTRVRTCPRGVAADIDRARMRRRPHHGGRRVL